MEQRNTVDELETYPEELQELLERVLDEYGLIVCGWSADWDRALVRAVEGTRSRRYPLFWSQYGRFSDAARALTAQHDAVVIDGRSADEPFTDLVRRVEALDRLTATPITRDVAVVQLKRALPDPPAPHRAVRPRRPGCHTDRRPQHARAQAGVRPVHRVG
ncbi:hypothetical protein [Streptomyces sp. NBC_01233]|uniref:hypothetical protein n=1 Tax=Streptomyces sp. NBC_01233 TaxID=2903787 RepID=UPI002E133E5B|nr:hypothetical protein OG332_34450 [Streptomyces sp. NBC_01233]